MRLFVAIDIDETIRHRITTFMEGVRGFAPDVRWVGPETLHITLKFIGEYAENHLSQLTDALRLVRGTPANITFHGTGFFPTPKAARVLWVGMEYDDSLRVLAAAVDNATTRLAIPREGRPFKPH